MVGIQVSFLGWGSPGGLGSDRDGNIRGRKRNAPPRACPGAGLRSLDSSGGRTRTCDPTVNSRLLYQLSYAGMAFPGGKKKKLPKARKGVNGPAACRFGNGPFGLLPLGLLTCQVLDETPPWGSPKRLVLSRGLQFGR